MRTAKKILAGTLCACLCALLCGCELLLVPDGYVSSRSSGGDRHQAVNKAAPAEGIGDRDSLYSAYDSTDPVCFYVTKAGIKVILCYQIAVKAYSDIEVRLQFKANGH